MNLPADVARCEGVYHNEDGEWREGCETCLRRTDRPEVVEFVRFMEPPPIVALWCEALIEPGAA